MVALTVSMHFQQFEDLSFNIFSGGAFPGRTALLEPLWSSELIWPIILTLFIWSRFLRYARPRKTPDSRPGCTKATSDTCIPSTSLGWFA